MVALVAVGARARRRRSLIQPWLGIENVDLVFLTAIVGVAVRFGLWPSLARQRRWHRSATTSSSCRRSTPSPSPIRPTSRRSVFFIARGRHRLQRRRARAHAGRRRPSARARTTEALYAFSRKLAGVGTLDDVLWATAYQIALMLKVRVVLLLPEDGSIAVKAGYPPEDTLDEADLAAAKWAWDNDRPAGRGSDTLPGAKRLFLPMRTGRGAVGVVGIDSDKPGPLLDARPAAPARRADRPGGAGDRARAPGRGHRPRQAHGRDRPAALGAAHLDLARPEDAACRGPRRRRHACATCRQRSTTARKADLLATIIDESERLNRFIANLLDMTKLESGAIEPKPRCTISARSSAARCSARARSWRSTRSRSSSPPDLPMLELDAVLFEQVLFNLLDNAAKYAPPGTTVRIQSWREGDAVSLQVLDEGEGIPPDELEHIFDKFYRAQKGDQVRAGTGLGLAISRGFVEAMDGTISAANRTDRTGAVFTIGFPIPADAKRLDTAA